LPGDAKYGSHTIGFKAETIGGLDIPNTETATIWLGVSACEAASLTITETAFAGDSNANPTVLNMNDLFTMTSTDTTWNGHCKARFVIAWQNADSISIGAESTELVP
jgi:hypothetical protein